ncbi:hypothetical protein [Armatimonas sp.]|uniref:hypothetical protein n=1 Tax=Armatimonas sp. TaxID=1872638 RepID=UPI00286BED8B|nr:hypothetical protein [Armatimonas sp.]
MKQSLPTGVIIGVIALLVIGLGLLIWKQTQSTVERDSQGNLVTGIDVSKIKSPAEIKADMDKMVRDEKAAKGTR